MKTQIKNIETWAYFTALSLLAMSLPISRFTMSVSQFTLLGVWLLSGIDYEKINENYILHGFLKSVGLFFTLLGKNFVKKMHLFLQNRVAVILVSLYVMHVIGLAYTSDFNYALKDLRVKLPILLLPIVMCTTERLSEKKTQYLFALFVLAVFVTTVISFYTYLKGDFNDVRQLSPFIYPIRFALLIVVSIFILIYFLFQKKKHFIERLGLFSLICWMFFVLIILESMNGIISTLFIVYVLLVYFTFSRKTKWNRKISLGILIIIFPLAIAYHFVYTIHDLSTVQEIDFSTLEKTTPHGNAYLHDTIYYPIENGKYTGLYISKKELPDAWAKRSEMPILGKDKKNQPLQSTLIRYLASKDLRKDADGVAALTDKDVRNIECGIANVNYIERPGLRTRLSKMMLGYRNIKRSNDPNGSSSMQRIEYLKISYYIIKKNPIFGIGTGDIPNAYKQAYEETDSPLKAKFRLRAHNQYLSITVGFGIVGLCWFLVVLFYPYFSDKKHRNYFYSVFMMLILLSMLSEDTIESQDGVTLYAFFNSLFLFALPFFKKENIK